MGDALMRVRERIRSPIRFGDRNAPYFECVLAKEIVTVDNHRTDLQTFLLMALPIKDLSIQRQNIVCLFISS
jgi:hypothetical protein